MYNSYVVVFRSNGNKKINTDTFYARSASEARKDFAECYRHGEYVIIGVLKIPEE